MLLNQMVSAPTSTQCIINFSCLLICKWHHNTQIATYNRKKGRKEKTKINIWWIVSIRRDQNKESCTQRVRKSTKKIGTKRYIKAIIWKQRIIEMSPHQTEMIHTTNNIKMFIKECISESKSDLIELCLILFTHHASTFHHLFVSLTNMLITVFSSTNNFNLLTTFPIFWKLHILYSPLKDGDRFKEINPSWTKTDETMKLTRV